MWHGIAMGRALDLRSVGCRFKSYSRHCCVTTLGNTPWFFFKISALYKSFTYLLTCSHLCASVTKQYNMVPAKGQWCFAAGEVTVGLAESNGSLPLGGWLTVTCGLTACTPASALGPTLSIKYGKAFTFYLYHFMLMFSSPLPSNRHHRSSGDCLEGKGENYQVCSVQYCVQQLCTVWCTHIWTD